MSPIFERTRALKNWTHLKQTVRKHFWCYLLHDGSTQAPIRELELEFNKKHTHTHTHTHLHIYVCILLIIIIYMKIKQIAEEENSTYTISTNLFWIIEASELNN